MASITRPFLGGLLLAFFLVGPTHGDGIMDEALREKVRALEAWLAKRGIVLGGEDGVPLKIDVSVASSSVNASHARPELRLVATRPIPRGQDIVHFTSSLIVHSDALPLPYHDVILQGNDPEELGLWQDYSTLAAWILREREKGTDSEWAPVIAILPELVPLTIFFKASSLQVFEDEALADGTEGWRHTIEEEYRKCDPMKTGSATEDEFKWAMSLVISRAYASAKAEEALGGVSDEDFTGPGVLIPLADLVNHGYVANWRRFTTTPGVTTSHKDGGFVFRATRDIAEGEELIAAYGQIDNRHTAMVYGYVPDHNPDEHVVIAGSVDDTLAWLEQHLMANALQGPSEEQAAELAHAAQSAVEDIWRSLETKYKLSLSGKGEVLSPEELQRAEDFASRAQYALKPTGHSGRTLAVWPGGKIDPRVVAALTAVTFYASEVRRGAHVHRDDLDLPALANASINYGWAWVRGPCESLVGALGTRYAQAMVTAGGVLQSQLKALLKNYRTKAKTDKKCLSKILALEIQVPDGGELPEITKEQEREAKKCIPELLLRRGVRKHELLLALKYRIQKKDILQEAIDRLDLSCKRVIDEL